MSAVPNYARMPGFGDLPGDDSNPNSPDYDGSLEEAVDTLAEEYARDPDMCRKADDWNDGCQSEEHYSAVERALADLWLYGVDEWPRVMRLAEVHAKARLARLEEWAREEVERENAENERNRAEARELP